MYNYDAFKMSSVDMWKHFHDDWRYSVENHKIRILFKILDRYGRFSKNVQIHVTVFYLLEKTLNSNWKWFHETKHNIMNKRNFAEGIEVLGVLRKICLNPPKCHKIACNSAAIATLNVIFVMRGRVKLNKTYPIYLDYLKILDLLELIKLAVF